MRDFVNLFFALAFMTTTYTTCYATSSGAGTCGAGESISTGPHGKVSSGNVDADSLFQLSFNDQALEKDSISTIEQNSNTIELKSTLAVNHFKGFLIRLVKKDPTLSIGLTTLTSTSDIVQPAQGCDSDVRALTHTSSVQKTTLLFDVVFEHDTEYVLEVTVVRDYNEWYYSRFEFTSTTQPTTTPPTGSQSTEIYPSASPTTKPTPMSKSIKHSCSGLISIGIATLLTLTIFF